jgi:orotidine-5'-phosphate decarboxylase
MAGQTFYETLQQAVESRGHGLCVGLDPDPGRLPGTLGTGRPVERLAEFLDGIVEATLPHASVYKCQLASYLAFGPEGVAVLGRLTRRLRGEVPVILDLKASDIPNTMGLYARAAFDAFGCSAVTSHPYMGWESIEALSQDPAHGVFVVARGSNPGATEIQDLPTPDGPLWQRILAGLLARASRGNLGAAVGATRPQAVAEARRFLGPSVPLLVLGVGAQGGDLGEAIRGGRGDRPGSLLVNSSRGILFASSGEDWAEAAGREAERLSLRLAETG